MNFDNFTPLYLKEIKEKYFPDKHANMQIITHDDMDGYASAAVVYHAFRDAEIISDQSCTIGHYNYAEKIPTINRDADIVFITDYSISNKAFMNNLLESFKSNEFLIFWCDHHATSIDNCKGKYEELKNIPGIRSKDYCGAALAWFFLNPGKKGLPYFLKLVDDFDCWKKKIPESDYLNYAFNYLKDLKHVFFDSKSNEWATWINTGTGNISSILEYGKKFKETMEDFDYANIRRNGFIGVLDKFPKIKMICLCNDSKGSQLFSDLLKSKEHPNGKYDYACAFQYNGISFTVSIYCKDDAKPNAKEICEAYGGGGHPGAAGFTTKTFFVEKVDDLPDKI